MFRSTRGLLLLAIVLILGAVGATYYQQRRSLARHAPPVPKALPLNVGAAARSWIWTKDQGNDRSVQVRATNFRQVNDPDRIELDGVELRLYKDAGKVYDLIRSAKALFDQNNGTMYSDGDVEITMGVPAEGPASGRLLNIKSSGVTFESKTGKAYTDRAASFTFDRGDGKSVGASYDPNVRELIMKSQVELHWKGADAKAKPMKLEAAQLVYRERDSAVLLSGWARLTRENTVLDASGAYVRLEEGVVRSVDAAQARGTDHYPGKQLEYSADKLLMEFSPEGEIQKVVGNGNARLVDTSDAARTTVTAGTVDLLFEPYEGGSALRKAFTKGDTHMVSAPLPRKGMTPPETKVLHSDQVELTMRAGGRELERIDTLSPGRLEFVPNHSGQRHRTLDADRMNIVYGAANQLESFRATQAATRTDPEAKPGAKKGAPPPAPILTWSRDLSAAFDPKTGQMSRLEQWNDFRYEEGERKARAQRAVLEEAKGLITLDQSARVWDPGGAASADRILLDQKSGDIDAEGRVVSTRMPDKKGNSSAMLSNDEPLEATADRMRTSQRNQKIRYEGRQAVAWQGANRLWADVIDIDRIAHRLTATGNVKTQLIDKPKPQAGAAGPQAAPAVIVIQARSLVYTDGNRTADYTGGAHLVRPGMDVTASRIRAFLNDANADSSLDHAIADGKVRILRTQPDRTLRGASEHAEYYAADQRIVLSGGEPTLVDSLRGETKGNELTYWANNDKLLVNGAERSPVVTRIRRR